MLVTSTLLAKRTLQQRIQAAISHCNFSFIIFSLFRFHLYMAARRCLPGAVEMGTVFMDMHLERETVRLARGGEVRELTTWSSG